MLNIFGGSILNKCCYSPPDFRYSFLLAMAISFITNFPVPPLPSVSDKKFPLAFGTSAYFSTVIFCRFFFLLTRLPSLFYIIHSAPYFSVFSFAHCLNIFAALISFLNRYSNAGWTIKTSIVAASMPLKINDNNLFLDGSSMPFINAREMVKMIKPINMPSGIHSQILVATVLKK